MNGQLIGLARNFRAALVSDRRNVMATPDLLFRQDESRNQVPPDPPGGEHVMAGNGGHFCIPLNVTRGPFAGLRKLKRSRLRKGLRRVIANRKPMPRHSAMVEEPP